MRKGWVLGLCFWAAVGFLGPRVSAQTVVTEPAEPAWGGQLRVRYVPAEPVKAGQEAYLKVFQPNEDGSDSPEDLVRLKQVEGAWVGDVRIRASVSNIQLLFYRGAGAYDGKARRTLMAFRPDGQPARGACLSQANSRDYLDWVRKELALYPENYLAYRKKWQLASLLEPARLKDMIEADLREVDATVQGEPISWLMARAMGFLLLKQEEKSREALRKMFAREPDGRLTQTALGDYVYQAYAQRIQGDGPREVNGMIAVVLKRNPATDYARSTIGNFCWNKETPLDVTEAVCLPWIEAQPENPMPSYYLAVALRAHDAAPERIAPRVDRALDLFVRGKARAFDVSPMEESMSLPFAYQMSAEAAFKQRRYAQAIGAVKAAQALNRESSDEAYLLEARIWREAGMPSQAEAAFLAAWKHGSRAAEDALREQFQRETGSVEGFAAWLAKKSESEPKKAEAKPRFAEFAVTSLKGAKYDLAALRGKVVVLNFWFIGCGPCKAEMPDLNRLVKEYAGREVVFLALALDDAESLRAFLKSTAFEYEIVPSAGDLADKLGVQAFPAHYVLNANGELELMLRGSGEKNVEQVRNVLARLLAAKKG